MHVSHLPCFVYVLLWSSCWFYVQHFNVTFVFWECVNVCFISVTKINICTENKTFLVYQICVCKACQYGLVYLGIIIKICRKNYCCRKITSLHTSYLNVLCFCSRHGHNFGCDNCDYAQAYSTCPWNYGRISLITDRRYDWMSSFICEEVLGFVLILMYGAGQLSLPVQK